MGNFTEDVYILPHCQEMNAVRENFVFSLLAENNAEVQNGETI